MKKILDSIFNYDVRFNTDVAWFIRDYIYNTDERIHKLMELFPDGDYPDKFEKVFFILNGHEWFEDETFAKKCNKDIEEIIIKAIVWDECSFENLPNWIDEDKEITIEFREDNGSLIEAITTKLNDNNLYNHFRTAWNEYEPHHFTIA